MQGQLQQSKRKLRSAALFSKEYNKIVDSYDEDTPEFDRNIFSVMTYPGRNRFTEIYLIIIKNHFT